MKRSLLISVLAATAVTLLCTSCGGSKVGRAPVRDLVLIYDGGEHRTVKWNAGQFADYVATDGETPEWLFDGFLFLEIHSGTGLSYASGYTPTPARKQDWITLIDKYLTPGRDIAALNECVGTMRERIPGPFHRRKIVLSLPEPIPGQTDWGEIDGRNLDFNDDADRTAACIWYIDLLIERFTAAGLERDSISIGSPTSNPTATTNGASWDSTRPTCSPTTSSTTPFPTRVSTKRVVWLRRPACHSRWSSTRMRCNKTAAAAA